MALSILEFAFLGLLGYGTIVLMMITLVTEPPNGRSFAALRLVMLVPGMLALWVLASPGPVLEYDPATGAASPDARYEPLPTIVISDTWRSSTEVVRSGNGSVATNATVTAAEAEVVYLHSLAWWVWHWTLGLLVLVWIFVQLLQLFTRPARGQ